MLPSDRVLTAFACMLIITLGAFLRLAGTNWDEGANLHPDERHMVFVLHDTIAGLKALKSGELSPSELWFAAERSPFDPRLTGRLYVYGELPHLVVSLATRITGDDGWPEVMLFGRTLSAVLDSYTILAVFFLVTLLCRSALASLAAAAIYACTPLALQNANFFTVDTWLTAAIAWTLVATTLLVQAPGDRAAAGWAIASGALAGAAMACKLPGAGAFSAIAVAIAVRHWQLRQRGFRLLTALAHFATALLSGFIVFRLASPFHFAGPHVLGLALAPAALDDYVEAGRGFLDPGYPPNWQWLTGYGPMHAVADLAMWGLGPIASLIVLASVLGLVIGRHRSYDRASFLPIVALILAFSVYWLSGIPALRYVLPALPALCAMTVIAFARAADTRIGRAGMGIVLIMAGLWGLGMPALHANTNSRIAASRWLWSETSVGTVIANETAWDEGLPVAVMLPGRKTPVWPDQEGHFQFVQLQIEAPDSPEKARNMAKRLGEADMLVISSERFRKPMLALSERFPMTAAYYRLLARGELCFEPVYSDPSTYPLVRFDLDDRWAQEPWSVYDHPTVEIYRKLPCYDAVETERRLLQALPNGS
jgi:hypothetical protein